MGCSSSSLLMSPTEVWRPCGSENDEIEWDSARTTSAADGGGYPLKCGCSIPSKSNFDLSQLHPSDPPFLGSTYFLPADTEYFFTETPPPRLAFSPDSRSLLTETRSMLTDATCSTSDNTLVMSNIHHAKNCDASLDSFSPKRLFDDYSPTSSSSTEESSPCVERPKSTAVIHQGVLIKGKLESPCRASKRPMPKRIDTLPSTVVGQPIRLRVVESYGQNSRNDCSYDPYFSTGKFDISTANGSPYGNDLSVQMGPQHMTLQEGDGRVVAVMRSRHTFEPSHVIYGSKPRFDGQVASDAIFNSTNNWYPWALVKKDGPAVTHDATVYLNHPQGWGDPVWKSRHGFVGKTQTHTVVTRVISEIEEVPCCLVLRDPVNHHAFNLTIAPGIDPILTICYLAVHTKMDVEPLLSSVKR